ncbi:MAG: hypothetical protein M3680_32090 [Myxococcota bacterium]|nr:hypothetical protein [Myxococcota bacterium]
MRHSRSLFVALALSVLSVAACGGGGNTDEAKGLCSDGVDNDGDGTTDFPDDLGCMDEFDNTEDSPPMPQCSDGRDNDGDGRTDFPNDPGCFAAQADDETDDCPSGPACPQCANEQDDDSNGATDFPNDTGCESASDNSEFLNNPVACGAGMKVKQLPSNGQDTGMLEAGSTSMIMSPCGGGGGVFAVAYVLHLPEPKVIVATTDAPETNADTVIDIRSANCADPASHLACSDDISTTNDRSTVARSLTAGVYYIIVQGQNTSVTGTYSLKVDRYAGEGTQCTMQEECGPGLFCRTPFGGSQMVCSPPVCNDGLDDDGDGKIDYPNDPGCSTPGDDTETDSCPGVGPNCPECGDGVDNDADTTIDYPLDLTCKAAGDSSESCTTTEGVVQITTAQTMGDTTLATSDLNPTCASSAGSGPDRTYRLDLPAMQSLDLNLTASFDTATVLFNSTCGGAAIKCSDPLNMNVLNLAAGTYYFVVDGYSANAKGAYTINVSGKIASGQSCEVPLAVAGALTCGTGLACKGTAGSRTCQPAQCGDGIDNNGDSKIDYPADPGCTSTSDDTETTVCPGAGCPVCSNGLDDDMDGLVDYPADTSCVAASGNNESCTSTEPVTTVTMPATMGTTVGATNDTKLTCSSSSTTALAPDVHYRLDLPATTSLTLSLTGKTPSWDSSMALFNSSCTGTALRCSDPDSTTITDLAAGTYFLAIDGWSSGSGNFTLNVAGTIAGNASCESALATSGALACTAGFACKGTVGSRTCQPAQCNDGIDNNGNGPIDYPNDPGCSSAADDTETTVCPGVNCPVCANGLDDDADTMIDFPADFGCSAAGGMSEAFCIGEPDVAGAITAAITMGTLAAAADNYDQTCQTNTGNDLAYALQLPVPVASLVIDTDASTISDTVLSLKDASCGTQLGCDDDSGVNGLRSKLTVTNVPAGNYAIQVDSYGTSNNGDFTLTVRGTVAAQTACTSPLFAAGVLACPTGTTCSAGKCQ